MRWINFFLLQTFEWWHLNSRNWLVSISISPFLPTYTPYKFYANFSLNLSASVDRNGIVLLKSMLRYCFVYFPVNFYSIQLIFAWSLVHLKCNTNCLAACVSCPPFHFCTMSIWSMIALKIQLQGRDFFARIDPSLFLRSHQIKEYLWQITMRKITTVEISCFVLR